MQIKINIKKRYIVVLLILLIGIGFAALTEQLNIFGTSNVKGNTWNIHWENAVLDEDSSSTLEPVINAAGTTVTYTIDLSKPGDFYEFTVDAVNDGTIDAMIKSFSNVVVENDTTTTTPSYINYTITYFDGKKVSARQLLAAGEVLTFRVRVEFKEDIENNELPGDDSTLTFNFTIDYKQADDTAVNPNTKSITCKGNRNMEVPEGTVCKRATKLNYEECTTRSYGCNSDLFVYGNCGTKGEAPAVGDAFDCDVDNSGTFDVDERFYYISDSGSDEGYATLVYYKETGVSSYYNYYGSNNYSGPLTALEKLPSTSEWTNAGLNKEMTRQITNELGTTTSNNGSNTLPQFTYTGKSARLLTYQELVDACEVTGDVYISGKLNKCKFLFERSFFANNKGRQGFFLETPQSSTKEWGWVVSYTNSSINTSGIMYGEGIRPAIEVDKTKIVY